MKKSILLLLLLHCLSVSCLFGQSKHYPVPTSNFIANYCNFPLAWESSQNKTASITIISEGLSKGDSIFLQKLVPNADIRTIRYADFLKPQKFGADNGGIVLLLEEPKPATYKNLQEAVKRQIDQGRVVVLPAVFSKMDSAHCSAGWQQLLRNVSAAGAIVVGAHGPSLVIGDLSFLRPLPIDVFGLVDIDNEGYPNSKVRLEGKLENGTLPVVAGLALRKGNELNLTSKELKDELQRYSSKAIWGDMKSPDGDEFSNLSIIKSNEQAFESEVANQLKYGGQLVDRYSGSYFDAGHLVAHRTFMPKEWSYGVLQADSLRLIGSGKGVKVAILDHLFSTPDTTITSHYIMQGSVFPSFRYDAGGEGHGVWMARCLLHIAPEVSIVPIRITNKEYRSTCEGYVKGIDYAISKGVDIISLSHEPVRRSERAMLDSAIARASQKNICFVYIHYAGSRSDVVRTSPIEFVQTPSNSSTSINIIGTGFNGEDSFPFTWGFSQTAPIVSGVIALMKEKNPSLKNGDIIRILRESYKENKEGFRYLDAVKALRNARKH